MRAVERPISEEDLQGYVDERLERERREKVERYLDAQPELSRRVAAYRDHRIALRMALASHASEPIPPELNLNLLLETDLRRRPSLWRLVATILLSLCLGGAGGWYLTKSLRPGRAELAVSLLQQQAIASHAVYTDDPRHPIEMAASERDQLSHWLSNRLDRDVAPPDLVPLGYHLLGGRLLATEHGGAAALFVYQDAAGTRLSVLLRPMAPDLRAPQADISQGSVNGCTWIDKGMGYAVVASAPEATLDRIVDRISGQSGGAG